MSAASMHFIAQILIVFSMNMACDYVYFHYTFESLQHMILTIQNTNHDLQLRKKYGIVVYMCMSIGLYLNVLQYKNINGTGLSLLLGSSFGFVVFAVYDFTNMVVFDKWTLAFAIRDISFGMCSFLLYTLVVCVLENALS